MSDDERSNGNDIEFEDGNGTGPEGGFLDPLELASERYAPEPLQRVRKDIRQGVTTLSFQEIRFLVDLYYSVQHFRISSANQVRALGVDEEPATLLEWGVNVFRIVEDEIRKGLDLFSRKEPTGIGLWQRSITGIGPVIASGMLAHIDITRAATAGNLWSFAGLNPTQVWEPHTKRPWNAQLKVLCWKAGESFVKVSSNKNDTYGQVYQTRKELEIRRNEDLLFQEQAEHILATKRIRKETDAYKAYVIGKLPPGHLHARAKRYAVKLYLAHLHLVMFWQHHGQLPPLPYPIVHLGHAHVIAPPHLDLLPGLEEAYNASPAGAMR